MVSAATSLTTTENNGTGLGNATVGIFVIGGSANTNKYTYSGDTVAAGGSLMGTSTSGASTGNSTKGLIARGGAGTSNIDTYTYATDAVGAATALHDSLSGGCAMSNGNLGVVS